MTAVLRALNSEGTDFTVGVVADRIVTVFCAKHKASRDADAEVIGHAVKVSVSTDFNGPTYALNIYDHPDHAAAGRDEVIDAIAAGDLDEGGVWVLGPNGLYAEDEGDDA